MKRRKFRAFLVMSTIAISVLAFINLTSFIFEEGFVVEKVKGYNAFRGHICLPAAGQQYLSLWPPRFGDYNVA